MKIETMANKFFVAKSDGRKFAGWTDGRPSWSKYSSDAAFFRLRSDAVVTKAKIERYEQRARESRKSPSALADGESQASAESR